MRKKGAMDRESGAIFTNVQDRIHREQNDTKSEDAFEVGGNAQKSSTHHQKVLARRNLHASEAKNLRGI